MAISSHDAERIHLLAQKAGVPDATIEQWTEEAGGYRYAITGHTGTLKARQADQVAARIRKHVQDREHAVVTAAAEAVGVTPPPAPGTPMVTPKQVDFILSLLDQRRRSGDGGGFMSGPTDRAGIEGLTRREASTYITSLKEDY
ncbi:hypothetical protein ABT160_02765 [Streptomyces sp. NPDC001941]|uniref:hypothetical protein n=1 Tax=Streptomyces sp. NPDC001941 TaxID=3154659 RepID=UPI00332AD002